MTTSTAATAATAAATGGGGWQQLCHLNHINETNEEQRTDAGAQDTPTGYTVEHTKIARPHWQFAKHVISFYLDEN